MTMENTVVVNDGKGNVFVYSIYQGLNDKTDRLGWFAMVSNEERILRMRWYSEENLARNAMIRWRLNRLLGDEY